MTALRALTLDLFSAWMVDPELQVGVNLGEYRYGDNRTRYCNVDTRYGVQIVRQLSRDPCVEGRSWGMTQNSVWVSRGCRAEFSTGDRYNDERVDYRRY